MHVLGLLLVVGVVAANAANQCPKEQEQNWQIELLLEHEDCNKFYKCAYGQPVEKLCPPNLYFNIATSQCDWQENVNCGDRNIPDDSEESQEDAGDNGNGDGDGDELVDACNPQQIERPEFEAWDNGCPKNASIHWLLPHESECNQFYYCVGSERVLTNCPAPLQFNRIIQVCVLRQQACCAQSFNKHASSRRLFMRK